MRWVVSGLLGWYKRLVSPILPEACRFSPTCSVYTRSAVEKYGVIQGLWLGIKRLLRCHPWHPGGDDPVP
ncbi:membrane protein insertion efficiency factor YidD [bacterium]|nr:membrane protein insertion efficiency factor YidD [candidate division CSSED10-310 bacterium]